MKLAIEYGITIDFNQDDTVCAIWTKPTANLNQHDKNDYIFSEDCPKAKTGEAVADAFLMMDIEEQGE